MSGQSVWGKARCTGCGYIWLAVAPLGTKDVICPRCTRHLGVFAADPLGYHPHDQR